MARWSSDAALLAHDAPNYSKLQTIPENRVYLSAERADEFVGDFVAFSQGAVTSDDGRAPGVEIGRPSDIYRRVRIDFAFGTMAVLVTDGHLPYPYGREITGYEFPNLSETLNKAKAAGAVVLVEPYIAGQRYVSMVEFPGAILPKSILRQGTNPRAFINRRARSRLALRAAARRQKTRSDVDHVCRWRMP